MANKIITLQQMAKATFPSITPKKKRSESWGRHVNAYNRRMRNRRIGFVAGYTKAVQEQPIWREIDARKEDYFGCVLKSDDNPPKIIDWCADALYLLSCGYTHYISKEDLLKIPTEPNLSN